MIKRILLFSMLITFSITGCGKSTESESKELSTIDMSVSDGTITYAKYELTNGPDNEKGIRVYYTYTHKSDQVGYPDSTFDVKAFQNNEELEWAYTWSGNDCEDNMQKGIQKDETLEVAKQYKLQNTTSPVTLHVNEFANYNNKNYQEMVIEIDQTQ